MQDRVKSHTILKFYFFIIYIFIIPIHYVLYNYNQLLLNLILNFYAKFKNFISFIPIFLYKIEMQIF